jgi:protein-L-isoaspartate O-methyltransferase
MSAARELIERARQADVLAVAQRYGAKLGRIGRHEFAGLARSAAVTTASASTIPKGYGIAEAAVRAAMSSAS